MIAFLTNDGVSREACTVAWPLTVNWPQEERLVGSADQDLPYHHKTVNAILCVSLSAAALALSLSRPCTYIHTHKLLYENLLLPVLLLKILITSFSSSIALMHPLTPSLSVAAAMLDNYCQCFRGRQDKGA